MPARPQVAPISASNTPEPPSNPKPLPESLYCPECETCFLQHGIDYTENTRGWRSGSASFIISNYNIFDYEVYEDETTDSDIDELSCRNCSHNLSMTEETWDFIKKIADRRDTDRWTDIARAHQASLSHTRIMVRPRLEVFTRKVINGEMVNCFATEILPLLQELNEETPGVIPQFNTNHEIYQVEPETEEDSSVQTEEEREEGPEDRPVISETHHRRWGNHVNYPNQIECPEEACKYLFIAEPNQTDFTCPRCEHEWDTHEINENDLSFSGNEMRFRVTATTSHYNL